jgi:2-polyprenyl-6-hydroxyphenyl methylase/3-demethylubiquinone-9 3-methyltransferase
MSLGSAVRALFGRHERRVADFYRALFVDLDDFVGKIRHWAPEARRILEVGCGEGAVTERLAAAFPDATILAIDITPRAGRLYRGRSEGVEFSTATAQVIARENPGQFDLVIMSDVVHHIPPDLRGEVIEAVGRAMAPDARFILKDWDKTPSLIHWISHASDRWLTGDRIVHVKPAQAKRLVEDSIPALRMVAEGSVQPWRNNYALVFAS